MDLGRAGMRDPPALGPGREWVECGVGGREARTQAVSGSALPLPWLTSWDQHVGQDGEATYGLGAGQDHAAAKEPEQAVVGGPAQEVHGSEEDLEEEDVTPQVLQVQDQSVVGDHVGEAAGQSQRSGPRPAERGPLHQRLTPDWPGRVQPIVSLSP